MSSHVSRKRKANVLEFPNKSSSDADLCAKILMERIKKVDIHREIAAK